MTIEGSSRSRTGLARGSGAPLRVDIAGAADIVAARERGRALAAALGFNGGDLTVIATVISELARNIVEYATRGTIVIEPVHGGPRPGMGIEARDEGPGIADLARALGGGSTMTGLGLAGVRRMVDEFDVSSQPGRGTTVTVRKWLP